MATKQRLRKRSASPRARFTVSSKNFLSINRPAATYFLTLLAALTLAVAQARSDSWAASEVDSRAAAKTVAIEVYASADETASPIGTLAPNENITPIAETHGAGGNKWYLVRSRSGMLGWIKQDDSEPSKKAYDFFRSLPAEPTRVAVQIPTTLEATAAKDTMIVPVTLSGGAIIVPVTFNGSVTANLLLDTGASMTMISHRLASDLALPAIGSRSFFGIGGTVNAAIARVDSIKVGDAEVGGMQVSIHDISRFPLLQGLLGMDFLGRFNVSVDSAKKLLVLRRK